MGKRMRQEKLRFDELPPLRDYQIEGAHWLVEHPAAILADEMGLGKTVTTITAACIFGSERPLRFLIVCPKTLKGNWEYEISRWAYGPTTFEVTHYEALRKGVPEHINAVIVDEAHYVKNEKAQRTKDVKYLSHRCEVVWLLTGTPVENKLYDFWSLLNILRANGFGMRWDFIKRYCDPVQVRHGRGMNDVHWEYDGATNVDEFRSKLENYFLRRTKEDVHLQLPEKLRTLAIIGDGKGRKYDWLSQYASEDEVISALKAKLDLTEWAKIWHETGQEKIAPGIAYCKDLREELGERNMVIFGRHKDVCHEYAEGLSAFQLKAEQSADERADVVHRFNTSKGKVLVSSLDVGAVGLTLTSADTMVFAEMSPSVSQLRQAEARIHRISQNRPCQYHYLALSGTIDYYLAKIIVNKANVIDMVLRKGEG